MQKQPITSTNTDLKGKAAFRKKTCIERKAYWLAAPRID
jgi:hypothetical protein